MRQNLIRLNPRRNQPLHRLHNRRRGSVKLRVGLRVQLRVQASGVSQASNIIVIEDEDGNDGFRVDRIGDTWISGTVTIVNGDLDVDAGDAQFDGAVTVTFGSILYVSDIVEASGDEGVNIEGSSFIDDDIIAGAALTTTTFMEIGTWLRPSLQATLVVTVDGTITATGTNQPISATAAIGLDDIAIMSDGDVLMLTNVGTNTVTITDTGVIMLSGDIALGQHDTLTLLCDGTNWKQIATSDN